MMRGALSWMRVNKGNITGFLSDLRELSPAVMRGVLTLIRVGVVETTISSDLQRDQAHRGVLGGAP